MKSLAKALQIIMAISLISAELATNLVLSGSPEAARYISISRDNVTEIEPYAVDTSNIMSALKEYKRLYCYGAWLHGAYLGFK
ncbi:MAG: hypothetical protein JW782_06120 [Candidatus Saganbacteria bacterium]|nr:hypothetical protein [Candidatus Saganbacteria bacterium]